MLCWVCATCQTFKLTIGSRNVVRQQRESRLPRGSEMSREGSCAHRSLTATTPYCETGPIELVPSRVPSALSFSEQHVSHITSW